MCVYIYVYIYHLIKQSDFAFSYFQSIRVDIFLRYLCDFIYCLSLHINKNRTAFIHVPPLNCPYNATELAQGLQAAIKSMLNQLTSP